MIYTLWSYDELRQLRIMGRRRQPVEQMARATGHTIREVELALWQLLGRDLPAACDALNLPILAAQADQRQEA
jgi:hypothetical protein